MKKNSYKLLLILLFALGIYQSADAQILKRILKESSRKVEREVTNMVVDKASDIIAQKAVQSLESTFDKMIRDAMESDSTYRNDGSVPDSAYYSAGQKYAEFLRGMNDQADLPDQYAFDVTLLVESSYTDHDPQEMRIYYAKDHAVMCVEQMEGKDKTYMVMDLEKDVVAMYRIDKKGRKTVQALPNMFKMAGSFASSSGEEKAFSFKATGKTKKIAGYTCEEFEGKGDEEMITAYFSNDVPVDWNKTFGAMMKRIAPTTYHDGIEEISGMVLESYTVMKKKPKTEYFYTTKEVLEAPFVIDNSAYEMASYQ